MREGDVGAAFENVALEALLFLKKVDRPAFQRARTELRAEKISLAEIDRALTQLSARHLPNETHDAYAQEVLKLLTVDGYAPVVHDGSLYVVEASTSLWVKKSIAEVVRLVSETHDGKKNCTRSSDYIGIAKHAMLVAEQEKFFADAAVGLACPNGFYRVVHDGFKREPLDPSHKQRVQIKVAPGNEPTPMFDAFIEQTFASVEPGEAAEQTQLVQEIAGAIVLGQMAKLQKAVLFYDKFGRAGKGTLDKILQELVPKKFITAVSPFSWEQEYYLMSLAGARLNTVGELPDDRSIPGAEFKKVIGGDLLTGRDPGGRPFTFSNEAAHVFTSNYLINTRDQSAAFFERWLIVEFPNSRLKTEAHIDPDLAKNIIAAELPGIVSWALEGARRLITNGKFSSSSVQTRLMQSWRTRSSNLEEFIEEVCELNAEGFVKRADLWRAYVAWCQDNGRKSFSKGKVKELLEQNLRLKVRHTTLNGNEIFRGIKFKEPTTGRRYDEADF